MFSTMACFSPQPSDGLLFLSFSLGWLLLEDSQVPNLAGVQWKPLQCAFLFGKGCAQWLEDGKEIWSLLLWWLGQPGWGDTADSGYEQLPDSEEDPIMQTLMVAGSECKFVCCCLISIISLVINYISQGSFEEKLLKGVTVRMCHFIHTDKSSSGTDSQGAACDLWLIHTPRIVKYISLLPFCCTSSHIISAGRKCRSPVPPLNACRKMSRQWGNMKSLLARREDASNLLKKFSLLPAWQHKPAKDLPTCYTPCFRKPCQIIQLLLQ